MMSGNRLTDFPELILLGTWMVAIFGYFISFGPVSLVVLVYVLSFCLAFLGGGVFFSVLHVLPKKSVAASPQLLASLVIVLAFANIYYAVNILTFLTISGSVVSALDEIRQSALQGNPVIDGMSYFVNANQLLFGLATLGFVLVKQRRVSYSMKYRSRLFSGYTINSDWLFSFGICLALGVSVLDGSRSFFMSAILTLLFILYQLKLVRFWRVVFICIVLLFVFAVTFPIFRPDVANSLEGLKFVFVYISGGLGSLDYVMRGDTIVYWRDIESLANKLEAFGLPLGGFDLLAMQMDYVDLPAGYSTNVYTALGVYYQYFGYASLAFAFLVGGFFKYLSSASKKNVIWVYIYSFYLTALVLSIFHDYLVSTTYLLFKILFICLVLNFLEMVFGAGYFKSCSRVQ